MRKLIQWIKSVFKRNYYKIKIVSELPNQPKKMYLYIEGNSEKEDYWYALIKCPCGCDERIMLNLMDDVKPCWELQRDGGNFSLFPSVWRTKNCKSHFWLKNKKIIWVD